jgi:hypothetical protein
MSGRLDAVLGFARQWLSSPWRDFSSLLTGVVCALSTAIDQSRKRLFIATLLAALIYGFHRSPRYTQERYSCARTS